MEEENEILGPQQAWSPEMLFTPSVEEEEEEVEESTKFLDAFKTGVKSTISPPLLNPLGPIGTLVDLIKKQPEDDTNTFTQSFASKVVSPYYKDLN